ncbi:uncharacterized protein [Chelonus insularis]|uniref:uncharacterized protein n=1 Tax=Chelonus insularis TaxID=460826 RepID=UPI00158D9864|nr:uncharacterized protein LOC118073638 [Chelonus insularis]
MMRGLISLFLLCNIAFIQVESYVITVDTLLTSDEGSPVIIEQQDYEEYDDDFKYEGVYEYKVTFDISSEDEQDLPIGYIYIDENYNIAADGETSLCNANLADPDGTVAAIVALVLGIKNDPVCPLDGSLLTQKSVFSFEGGNFSNLPNSTDEDDIMSVKLEIYSSNYMTMKLSITDDQYWFEDDDMDDPDARSNETSDDNSEGETGDESSEDSSNGQSGENESNDDQ